MEMPQFNRMLQLANSKNVTFMLNYTDTTPCLGICSQIPLATNRPMSLPSDMFHAASEEDLIEKVKAWIETL